MKSLSNFHVDGDWRVANAFGYLTIKKIKKIIIIKKANKIKKKKPFHALHVHFPLYAHLAAILVCSTKKNDLFFNPCIRG